MLRHLITAGAALALIVVPAVAAPLPPVPASVPEPAAESGEGSQLSGGDFSLPLIGLAAILAVGFLFLVFADDGTDAEPLPASP